MVRFRDSALRYWRGEYSLAVSFWLVGVLGLVLILLCLALYTNVASKADFHPYQALGAVVPVWTISGAFAVFQLVGTWRSAVRFLHERKHRSSSFILGWAAQTVAVGGVGVFLALLWQLGLPHFQESVGIAFGDDPDVDGYSLRLMRDATELEIAGGMKYGVARDVEALLAANPRVKIVHLNSSGGRLGEGQKLAALIRSRRLVTYTASECASACTVAFAAGHRRWVKDGASLGYHAASFGGSDSPRAMRDALMEFGVAKDFAERAARISSRSIWYPRLDELVKDQIVSGSVDAYRFASSGFGTPSELDEGIRDHLLESAIFRAVEDAAPEVIEQAVALTRSRYADGVMSAGDVLDEVRRTLLVPFLKARLTTADEQKLADFAELLADQLDALGHANPEECVQYFAHGATEKIYDDLPYALIERQDALLKELLKTPGEVRSPEPTATSLRAPNCQAATSMQAPQQAASVMRDVILNLYRQ